MTKRIICHMMMLVVAASSHQLTARELSAEYTTEIQTDLLKATNWVNLLRVDFSKSMTNGICFNFATISIAKTNDERLANDFQTFSNIEENNLPLALSVVGIEWQRAASMLAIGIRNVGEDYFTEPSMALFTNSSCGIFPTISANAPVPNYPFASLGIHYAINTELWQAQISIYNGTAHNHFAGQQNIFRFCPASDGLFSIISFNYQNHGNDYNLGGALYRGLPVHDTISGEKASQKETQTEKMTNIFSVWSHAVQRLSTSFQVLLQCSACTSTDAKCRAYAGMGIVAHYRKSRIGIFSDYASFSCGKEWATETTANIPLTERCTIQPALHCIRSGKDWYFVGLLRMVYIL